MAYCDFFNQINSNKIKTIFELGSRDLIDAIKLSDYFQDSKVYAFECNPDCLIECYNNIHKLNKIQKEKIFLFNKAVSINNSKVTFYPFDLQKYNNMGASSMLKIDFSVRNNNDPDYNKENPQKEIIVDGIRLDTFIDKNNIENIDLLCIDLQGYELNAIKSLGIHLHKVKYIITECSITSTYTNGTTFNEINNYLINYNFKYTSSNKFGNNFPDLTLKNFSEFDALFINYSAF
jgi:FkbM family methyltransferase